MEEKYLWQNYFTGTEKPNSKQTVIYIIISLVIICENIFLSIS